jgi:IrrE N-terminal-like domain
VFGEPAKVVLDLGRVSEMVAAIAASAAFDFVLAHECAHFLLGHRRDGRVLVDGDEVVLAGNALEQEFEADQFAAEVVLAKLIALGPIGKRAAPQGVFLALAAFATVEQGCWLRSPRSHPNHQTRWTQLCSQFGWNLDDPLAEVIDPATNWSSPFLPTIGQLGQHIAPYAVVHVALRRWRRPQPWTTQRARIQIRRVFVRSPRTSRRSR